MAPPSGPEGRGLPASSVWSPEGLVGGGCLGGHLQRRPFPLCSGGVSSLERWVVPAEFQHLSFYNKVNCLMMLRWDLEGMKGLGDTWRSCPAIQEEQHGIACTSLLHLSV